MPHFTPIRCKWLPSLFPSSLLHLLPNAPGPFAGWSLHLSSLCIVFPSSGNWISEEYYCLGTFPLIQCLNLCFGAPGGKGDKFGLRRHTASAMCHILHEAIHFIVLVEQLFYRATVDGFSSRPFRNKCFWERREGVCQLDFLFEMTLSWAHAWATPDSYPCCRPPTTSGKCAFFRVTFVTFSRSVYTPSIALANSF